MDLSAISNDDDFSRHMMPTPESILSQSQSPKLSEDTSAHIVHHQRIRISRPQIPTTMLHELNDQTSKVQQLDAMSIDELRFALMDKAKEIHRLRVDVQNRIEQNYNLRYQLNSRPGLSRSRSTCCLSPRITQDFHSTLCDYHDLSFDDRKEDDQEYEDQFLVPEDLKMMNDRPSRISVIISQSMTVLAQINNEEVLERVCAGSQLVKKLAMGSITGYLTSHLLKKFGKFAATSILGSVILIKMAHHRGYISVDWNRIQKQIESSSHTEPVDKEHAVEDDIAWVTQKIQQVQEWSRDNSYTVIGFWSGFLIHNFH